MVLDYLGRSTPYEQLLRFLDVKPWGAPAYNVQRLTALGLSVLYTEGTLQALEQHIQQGHPCIVFVHTEPLPYWSENTNHAVVLIGFDEENAYLNDPFFPEAPQIVSLGDFELAWLARDYMYALITE